MTEDDVYVIIVKFIHRAQSALRCSWIVVSFLDTSINDLHSLFNTIHRSLPQLSPPALHTSI